MHFLDLQIAGQFIQVPLPPDSFEMAENELTSMLNGVADSLRRQGMRNYSLTTFGGHFRFEYRKTGYYSYTSQANGFERQLIATVFYLGATYEFIIKNSNDNWEASHVASQLIDQIDLYDWHRYVHHQNISTIPKPFRKVENVLC